MVSKEPNEGIGCACMIISVAIAFAIIEWALSGFPGLAR